jgi:D-glycero-D-manno-heptose 1,7-bisphosphate phosphatase
MSGDPAIFLDRDGVLNAVVWREGVPASPHAPEELAVEPDAPAALARLKALGYRLFAVTNQPDVRRGKMSAEALEAIHARLAAALPLDEIAACIHDNADDCACRKPRPGLILDLAARWGIDLSRSWMIGDQDRDTLAARAAGCRSILLARPYNSAAGADRVVQTLAEAAQAIAPSPFSVPQGPARHVQ